MGAELTQRYREIFEKNLSDSEIAEIDANLCKIAQVIEEFAVEHNGEQILELTKNYDTKRL